LVQYDNAFISILVIVSGIKRDVILVHPVNALIGIFNACDDIFIIVEVYIGNPKLIIPKSKTNCGTVIDTILVHDDNIVVPILDI
jgi:hypothetical protein